MLQQYFNCNEILEIFLKCFCNILCHVGMNILDPFRRFFSLILILALFPWTNVMQLSKKSLVRWRRFHGCHCPDGNTHIKNGRSFKKIFKIHTGNYPNSNSYSSRIMFILVIVRFFIICFINGWKYEKVATNLDRITNWCVYLTYAKLLTNLFSNIIVYKLVY